MASTYTEPTGTGAGSAFQLNDKFGFQTAEEIRQCFRVLANIGAGYPLGGIELPFTVIVGGTYEATKNYISWDLNGDNFGGMTLEVVFFCYTSNAATSVTPRLRNTTDSTTAAQGAAVTATSVTPEVVTVTLASGVKTYRLEWTASNTTNPVYPPWGVLRFRKVPA